MLSRLSISNYAIIDQLDIKFDKGFNVITGETGAGKSIMLGALGLVVGNRADTTVLFDSNNKCVVEASFDISALELSSFFVENDLDFEKISIIRREITPAGKSRAFINDTPVNLQQLKEFTNYLIDVHSQHQTLELNAFAFQFKVLDAYAGLKSNINSYQKDYIEFISFKKELEELKERDKQSNLDLDYFQYQFEELEAMNLVEGEQENLEEEAKLLNNADHIKENLSQINSFFEQDDGPIEQLRSIVSNLSELKDFSKELDELFTRVNSAYIDLDDVAGDCSRIKDSFDVDQERLQHVNNRLDELYKLQQKHRVNSIGELIEFKKEIEERLSNVTGLSDKIEALNNKLDASYQKVVVSAKDIAEKRRSHAKSMKIEIEKYLSQLGMSEATFEIKLTSIKEPNNFGLDTIEFLFSANKGGTLNPLAKVASGGELSRLMLSIKTIISDKTALPTIIFDEIDTGVSGNIADKMADIMKQLSVGTQVFSITHLPQIAAKGNAHYVVYKESTDKRTFSKLKQLKSDERIDVLASMLSGEKVTQAALDNAKELLK